MKVESVSSGLKVGAAVGAAVVAAAAGFFLFTGSVATQKHAVQVSSWGGTQDEVLAPGRHIVPPWTSLYEYNTTNAAVPYDNTRNMSTNTKDGRADIDVQAYYQLDIKRLPTTHDRNPDFQEKAISFLRTAVRDIGAQYKTSELLDAPNRDVIAGKVRDHANAALKTAGIDLAFSSVVLRDVRQPKEIEAQRTVAAQQEAEQAANDAIKAKELGVIENKKAVELAGIEAGKEVAMRKATVDREIADAQKATRAAQAQAELAGQVSLTPQRLMALQIEALKEACSKTGATCIVDFNGSGGGLNRQLNITPATAPKEPAKAG